MRELTINEMTQVSGGGYITDALEWAHIGGEVGAIAGFIITETAKGAARGGLFGAAASFMFFTGYTVGSNLYEAFCR